MKLYSVHNLRSFYILLGDQIGSTVRFRRLFYDCLESRAQGSGVGTPLELSENNLQNLLYCTTNLVM